MRFIKFALLAGWVTSLISLLSYLVRCFPSQIPVFAFVLGCAIAGGIIAVETIKHPDARKYFAAFMVSIFFGVVGAWF